jgi:hypothetical protein
VAYIITAAQWRITDETTFFSVLLGVSVLAALPAPATNAFSPDQIQFGAVPPFLPSGAQLAVLEGNPTASSGDYTVRLKMPAGYKIAPHWHPKRENVTVIAGDFKVGMGDTWDDSKMMTFSPGSFACSIPACTTTPWQLGKPLSRCTDCLPSNATM